MQLLHPPSIITGFVYGLLILNAGAIRIQETTGLVCDGINSSEACDSGNENIARAIDAENDKRSPSTTNDILPRAPQQKPLVNCDLLLSKPAVQCTGLKKRTCNLLTWLYAGCTKARECADKTGVEAKKCCDNRDVLPFGGGTYYTGYMRACAPQYDLKRLDRPVFTRMECPKLESFTCEYWMGRHYCDLRDWERAVGLRTYSSPTETIGINAEL
ncbi:hypothetical protein HIM_08247 [Hirsutella minnesotensis 3608]|uniref:Extracellular membrane protein CFEM domain-containing protein n=1 Tax=Hirsutella minnesotensis 3608 TaxID=1043627 RepID=A0A0F7ZHA9_9HYPO|nr:hypothetical protein HIM_08247 [Hirsutella minnesotensis 3608]